MFKFQTLKVWQKSVTLIDEVFDLCDSLPRGYQFSLAEQLKKAVLSIANNIAEGNGRASRQEQKYFYSVAKASTYEVVSMLMIIKKKNFAKDEVIEKLLGDSEEIVKMLTGLMRGGSRV